VNIYTRTPNALDVARAYQAEREARSFAERVLLVCIVAAVVAVVSTTMAMVFRAQRDDAEQRACK